MSFISHFLVIPSGVHCFHSHFFLCRELSVRRIHGCIIRPGYGTTTMPAKQFFPIPWGPKSFFPIEHNTKINAERMPLPETLFKINLSSSCSFCTFLNCGLVVSQLYKGQIIPWFYSQRFSWDFVCSDWLKRFDDLCGLRHDGKCHCCTCSLGPGIW